MWRYKQLVDTLSGLYYRTSDIAALLVIAGFAPEKFNLDGAAHVVWTMAVKRIEQLEKIEQLAAAALQEFPDNPVLLDYKNNSDKISKSVYDGATPAWKAPPFIKQLEKITADKSTLLPISFLEAGTIKSHAVARVLMSDGRGSGFLISSSNLFLTNHHVLSKKEDAVKSKVQFNYQKNLKGLPAIDETFEIDDSVFETSEDNDWSVVRVKGKPSEKYGYLKLENHSVAKDDFVNIIQHPGGEYKQIGMYHNVVTFADTNIVQYLTDTMPGSSGSPVFNSEWDVVALHHSGGFYPEPGSQEKVLRNEGININIIREALLAKGFAL